MKKNAVKNKKHFLNLEKFDIVIFLLPFLVFLAALLIFFPGLLSFDSYNQLSQITTGVYSNAHPFFHTFIEMVCMKVANTPASVAFFQILVFSILWTAICKYNRKSNNKMVKTFEVIVTIFMVLNPINSLMSITLWKDILYSYSILSLTFIVEIIIDHKFKIKFGTLFAFAFNLILCCSLRHNGLSVTVGTTVFFTILLFIYDKKSWNFLKLLVLIVICHFIINIPANIYKVNTGGTVSGSSSILNGKMVQLTGAFLVNNQFTEDEMKVVSEYVNPEKLRIYYNPFWTDLLALTEINNDYINEHKVDIANMLVAKSVKYPKTFIDYTYLSTSTMLSIVRPRGSIGTVINTNIYALNRDERIYPVNENTNIYKMANDYLSVVGKNKVIDNMLYSPGFYFWLGVIVVALTASKISKRYYWLLIPNLMNVCGLIISIPVQDVRYAYASIIVTYLFMLNLFDKRGIEINMMNEETNKKKLDGIKNPKILMIIPAYNEEANIIKTTNTIVKYNKDNNTNYDYIVINDGSRDNTESILKENNINHVKLINNLGIGGAVQTGYKYALENGYDIAIQYDGDGQHDVKYVKDIIKPIVDGEANMVIGSRFVTKTKDGFKSSKTRRIGINLISGVIEFKTGKKIYDTTSGFRAVDSNIIKQFSQEYPTEYPEPISSVTVVKSGYKVSEVPVIMKAREAGTSSISSWKNVYYMINVFLSILLMKEKRR